MSNFEDEVAKFVSSDNIFEGRELRKEQWIMDSGASCHSCSNKLMFDTYEDCETRVFQLADGSLFYSTAKGTVKIMMFNKTVMTLSDVFYVPITTTHQHSSNLISLGTLESQGYEIILKNMCAKVRNIKDGSVVMMGVRSPLHNVYYLYSRTLVRIQEEDKLEEKQLQHNNNTNMNMNMNNSRNKNKKKKNSNNNDGENVACRCCCRRCKWSSRLKLRRGLRMKASAKARPIN